MTKQQELEALGFVCGPRDPLLNTNYVGQFMVVESHEPSELPTEDGRNGPWCIVGNDLAKLVDQAHTIWCSELVDHVS